MNVDCLIVQDGGEFHFYSVFSDKFAGYNVYNDGEMAGK